MTNDFGRYETPEGVTVSERQPAYCPYCGHSPAFDLHITKDAGTRHRCPDCGLEFTTYLPDSEGVEP